MSSFDYTTYLSPFTWRYGSDKMRQIWSEIYKRKLWRRVWVALAKAQHEEGLITKTELDDLVKHQNEIDIERAQKIEKDVRHDLMAEVKTYAQQARVGGGKIHLGATSMDIEDNADTVRLLESLIIIEGKLKNLLLAFSKKIDAYKGLPCIGYTHLQPAEPTTVGYRLAFYAQDLLLDKNLLNFVIGQMKGKGMKGAVGTAASYTLLLDRNKETLFSRKFENKETLFSRKLENKETLFSRKLENRVKVEEMEKKVMSELKIDAATITNQTAPRKFEFFVSCALSSIAQSLYKFAFDLRLMQSPGFGEWQEPFGAKQVGSSAMPFKKNPWKAEQICSLARLVFNLANIARDNSANMLLERTLDDSANRRVFIPEMFLAVDEILESSTKIIEGLVINEKQIQRNLEKFGPAAATEAILMAAVKEGADRQKMHEILRELSMNTSTPLTKLLLNDKRIMQFLNISDIKKLLDPKNHIGLAVSYCEKIIREIEK
ncbi:adenylosuccinate lyase [Candidatus Microgenomates bacterium]|nr:adenylosuccinate lyase [Candidatus Microgenomates bacterium]